MSTKPDLHVSAYELVYVGQLATPVLQLVQLETAALDRLFRALGPFEPTLQGASVNVNWQDLSQSFLTMKLLRNQGTLSVWPGAVQLTYSESAFHWEGESRLIETDQAAALVAATESVLAHFNPDIAYDTHSFWIRLHGKLTEVNTLDLLASYVSRPPPSALGAAKGFGVKFSFLPAEPRTESWIQAEPSAYQQDGLYIDLGATFDGSQLNGSDAVELMRQYVLEAKNSEDSPFGAIHVS